MLKLNTEKKLELKKIVIIAIALVICWMVFYVVSDLVDIPISINRLIIIALVILPMVIVYWESRKITRAHSINKEEIDLLYSELDAKKEELKIQSEELFQSQRSIEENDFRYKTLFDLTSEGLFGMDADYNIIYYSTGWYESIGVDIINPDFNQWLTFVLDEYKSKFITNIDNQFHSEEKDFASEYRIKDIHGDIHWIRAIGKSIFDENGKFSSMTGVHRDITESKLHEEAIIKTAYYDRLTGLPNRLKFEDMVNEAIGKLAYFGVLYIDIDSFKAINDTYSHAFGD